MANFVIENIVNPFVMAKLMPTAIHMYIDLFI